MGAPKKKEEQVQVHVRDPELVDELKMFRATLEKLLDVLTERVGDDRQLREPTPAQYQKYLAKQAFIMRQTRAAKQLGYTREEFRARFGNIDHVPEGAMPKPRSAKVRRPAKRRG